MGRVKKKSVTKQHPQVEGQAGASVSLLPGTPLRLGLRRGSTSDPVSCMAEMLVSATHTGHPDDLLLDSWLQSRPATAVVGICGMTNKREISIFLPFFFWKILFFI